MQMQKLDRKGEGWSGLWHLDLSNSTLVSLQLITIAHPSNIRLIY
jgi:hypothetical protein